MKLISKRGISVASPARKTSTSTPLPVELTSTASTAAPAPASAAPATSLAVPTAVPAAVFSAVPAAAAIVFAAASVVSDISPIVHALNIATTNQRPVTPANEPDITMESPPHPEGSSRATGGTLRNRAMGQHYNPVDDEELHISSIVEKVKGVVKIYVSPLDPVELDFAKMQPSMKVSVTVNMNLGPVLKEVAIHWPPITCKQFIKYADFNLI
jgi:hypothetical protein